MRKIDVEDLRLRSIKPLIYFKVKDQPELDMIAVIAGDEDDKIMISNPFLIIPIQDPQTQRLGIMLRPWSFVLPKDEIVMFNKKDLFYYYELTDKSMIDSYIGSTTNISLATPDQIPKDRVIDIAGRMKR